MVNYQDMKDKREDVKKVSSKEKVGVPTVREKGSSAVKKVGVPTVREKGSNAVKESESSAVKKVGVPTVKEKGSNAVKEKDSNAVKEKESNTEKVSLFKSKGLFTKREKTRKVIVFSKPKRK